MLMGSSQSTMGSFKIAISGPQHNYTVERCFNQQMVVVCV